jgi:hypothetical protein
MLRNEQHFPTPGPCGWPSRTFTIMPRILSRLPTQARPTAVPTKRSVRPPTIQCLQSALLGAVPNFDSTFGPADWAAPASVMALTKAVLEGSWAKSTRGNHLGAVRRFLAFCQHARVPSRLIFPVDEAVLCAFAANRLGRTLGLAARNDLAGVKAWHTLRNAPYPDSLRLKQIIKGVERARPAASHLPLRPPATLDLLRALCDALDPLSSFNHAVLACACVAFWGIFRLGELLPTSRAAFSATLHPTQAAWTDCESASLAIPWTKTTQSKGATVTLSPQQSRTCAIRAMRAYIRGAAAPASSPLFAYAGRNGSILPLTKKALLDRINGVWVGLGNSLISGHSFRIGGATELLCRGVNPDIMRVAGRWVKASRSFGRYWRKEDEIVPKHVTNLVGVEIIVPPRPGYGPGPGTRALFCTRRSAVSDVSAL